MDSQEFRKSFVLVALYPATTYRWFGDEKQPGDSESPGCFINAESNLEFRSVAVEAAVQAFESVAFDLADAFPGQAQGFADFLQRLWL